MFDCEKHKELIEKAKLGDRHSIDELSRFAEGSVRSFVNRLVMNHQAAEEIVQETVLEMLKALGKLKNTERFLPWLYGIALNKSRKFKRAQFKQEKLARAYARENPQREESLEDIVAGEVKELVSAAMGELKARHRAVLAMRCYDRMRYDEIAESFGCSNTAARMLFYRAKRSLAKKLSRHGLGKGAVLTAMILFGKMTATSEAAAAQVTVTAASMEVGLGTTLIGLLTSKTAVVTTAATCLVGAGVFVGPELMNDNTTGKESLPEKKLVSIPLKEKEIIKEEFWYFYPDNKGTVMVRTGKGLDGSTEKNSCLQNDRYNYYYHQKSNKVYIRNQRMWRSDFSVWTLPTDSPALTQFISKIQGQKIISRQVPIAEGGWLVVIRQDKNGESVLRTRHYNVLQEEYFRYNWPKGVEIVDDRDEMHKRGWTYFRISGEVDGKPAKGTGRIPFIYARSKSHYPWIDLKIGSEKEVSDGYGRLFKGLLRPWMGLHTIDVIRRDAAEQKLKFSTEVDQNQTKAIITVTSEEEQLVYKVDLKKDLIEYIELKGQIQGILNFEYLQNIESVGNEFISPRKKNNSKACEGANLLNLLELVGSG